MNNDIEWKMVKLLDKVSLLNGLTYSPENITPDGIGTLVMRSSNVQNNRFSFDDNVFVNCKIEKDKYIKKGDILVCVRNGSDELIGKNALANKDYPVTFGAFMSVLRAKDEITAKYIFWYLQKGDVIKEIRRNSEATINQITKKDFEKVFIPIPYKNGTPDLETQSLIAQKLGDMDSLISAKEKLLAKKRNLKTAAMQKLIKGEESENWRKVKMGDVVTFLPTNTLSRDELNYSEGEYLDIHYGDVLIKFDSITDVQNSEIPFITSGKKFTQRNLLKNGDIVMADTAEDESVGKVTEIQNIGNSKVVSGLHTICLRFKENLFVPKFAGFYFNSPAFHNLLLPYMHGTKVISISKGDLKKVIFSIPYKNGTPDLAEQKRIATVLSNMDSEIVSIEKEIMKLQNLKTAMMQKMFCFTKEDE